MRGLFVTGTDTNVGKTWVGKQLIARLLKKDIFIEPRKPVESGWSEDITQTDTWKLANAANKVENLDVICPNRFTAAISPDRAALLEDKRLSIETLKQQCLTDINNNDFLYVEGAGGFYSPICSDGLNADLATALNLPILLVAENRLGCINHTLLSIEAIEKCGLEILAIVLNTPREIFSYDSNMDNFEDLLKHINYPIISFNNIMSRNREASNIPLEKLCSLVTKRLK